MPICLRLTKVSGSVYEDSVGYTAHAKSCGGNADRVAFVAAAASACAPVSAGASKGLYSSAYVSLGRGCSASTDEKLVSTCGCSTP